jgi:hypothetical protein
MTDWLIVHNLTSYVEHPNLVGRTTEKQPQWIKEMKRGDRIVYYVTKEGFVMDMGVITSESQFYDTDEFWPKTWVRSFRSYLPSRKGLLITRNELKAISQTASKNIGSHALPAAIKLGSREFERISDFINERIAVRD